MSENAKSGVFLKFEGISEVLRLRKAPPLVANRGQTRGGLSYQGGLSYRSEIFRFFCVKRKVRFFSRLRRLFWCIFTIVTYFQLITDLIHQIPTAGGENFLDFPCLFLYFFNRKQPFPKGFDVQNLKKFPPPAGKFYSASDR